MKEEILMILENWVKTEENNLEKFENGDLLTGNNIKKEDYNSDNDNDNNDNDNENNKLK